MGKAQEQADIQRTEAKRLLNSAFGWGENIASEAVDRAVDCIISAAFLEMAAIQEEAMKQSGKEKSMSIKSRPVVYFPTMNDGELISYAESYSETDLEKELVKRLKSVSDELDVQLSDARKAYDDGYQEGFAYGKKESDDA